MSKKLGIILASHGYFAKYAMQSAEMIVGKQDNYGIVSVTHDKALDTVLNELNETYAKIKNHNGVVILTDILGGTPSNVSGNLLLNNDNVLVFTGFNMPVLLELLLNRESTLEEIEIKLNEVFKNSFVNLNDKLKGEVSNVDQIG